MNQKLERFAEAYLKMASEAKYRPAAPGDGCGNIRLSLEELRCPERLAKEARSYAMQFDAEEDGHEGFHIGCSDFRTNRAFIWTIEAARVLASGDDGNATALRLLKMAVADIKRSEKEDPHPGRGRSGF
jgi:hypothetical protein